MPSISTYQDAALNALNRRLVLKAVGSTVGPYREATGKSDRHFLVTGNGTDEFFGYASEALDEFIRRVGLQGLAVAVTMADRSITDELGLAQEKQQMADLSERPSFCKDSYLQYLDDLRENGVTNVSGVGQYLSETFPELSRERAKAVSTYWTETFGARHSLS